MTELFADELRKWWSFDDRQMHTHSWHAREDFIEKVLPGLLTQALSRLTASPLPEKIAELIERLEACMRPPGWEWKYIEPLIPESAAALQQQAREIEEKKRINVDLFDEAVRCQKRIRELEAEREAAKYEASRWQDVAKNKWSIDDLAQLHDRISELRETLAGMRCPREINTISIAECTGRNQCRCSEGAMFVKTGAAQK